MPASVRIDITGICVSFTATVRVEPVAAVEVVLVFWQEEVAACVVLLS